MSTIDSDARPARPDEEVPSQVETFEVDDPDLLEAIRVRLGRPRDRRVRVEILVYRDRPAEEGPVLPPGWQALTQRELAVAILAGQGLTNRQIARRVYISPHTVNYHLRSIFRKLSISSRVPLGIVARTLGESGLRPR